MRFEVTSSSTTTHPASSSFLLLMLQNFLCQGCWRTPTFLSLYWFRITITFIWLLMFEVLIYKALVKFIIIFILYLPLVSLNSYKHLFITFNISLKKMLSQLWTLPGVMCPCGSFVIIYLLHEHSLALVIMI